MTSTLRAVIRVVGNTHRHFSSKKIAHTSVFMQTGLNIKELPLVLKKVNDVLNLDDNNKTPKSNYDNNVNENSVITKEAKDVIEHMSRTKTVGELFKYLEDVKSENVIPPVAIHALHCIIDLQKKQNQKLLSIHGNIPDSSKEDQGSFLRFAFMNMLLDIVYRSRDPRTILEGLKVVSQDDFSEKDSRISQYKERIYEETLVLVCDGLFSLVEVCEAVIILSKFYSNDKQKSLEMADKLWAGIVGKAPKELDVVSVPIVFGTLPHLSTSRDVVFKLVSFKACDVWQMFSTKDILEIIRVMNVMGTLQSGYCQQTTLSMITQWLSVNFHKLSEQEMLAVVISMDKMEFNNETFTKILEKIMKVKGVTIKEADLVAAICDYCSRYQIRSKVILEASGEYFISHSNSLNTPQINSIAKIFGRLNYHPPNGFKFWDQLEVLLEEKFSEFPPNELVTLLLTFIYIERFPMNMVWKIFNPCFFDRMNAQDAKNEQQTKIGLDLIHTSLRIEKRHQYSISDNYWYTNTKSESKYWSTADNRITRLIHELISPLGNIVKNVKRIDHSILLPGLLTHQIYVADLLIYPTVGSSLFKFGSDTFQKNSKIVIFLIHPPNHYDQSGTALIGREAMRSRQLKKLGFKVVNLNYSIANKLLRIPIKLQEFLQREYERALKE